MRGEGPDRVPGGVWGGLFQVREAGVMRTLSSILAEFNSQHSALKQFEWVEKHPENATRLLWYLMGLKH